MYAPQTSFDARYDPHPDPAPPDIEPLPEFDPEQAIPEPFAMPATESGRERLYIAFHEAGHAVVGLYLAGINQGGYAKAGPTTGEVSFGSGPDNAGTSQPSDSLNRAVTLAIAAIFTAGLQCELLFSSSRDRKGPLMFGPNEQPSDYSRARKALAEVGRDDARWLWIAERVARNILTTEWDAVWLIAHHLHLRGELSAPELRRLFLRGACHRLGAANGTAIEQSEAE